ncbi:MAG: L-aspartate oxidase [Gammaproteobacteria bacterium]
MVHQHDFDVLIIGSGASGLSLALRLSEHTNVALISKGQLKEGSTYWAQGGIAAVLDPADTLESHVEDTLNAGAGLCDPEVVEFVASKGPASIEWLLDLGVPFTPDKESDLPYHLTREGGHSHRRIIHAADATGKAVEMTLEAKARANPNISIFEHHIAIDLITGSKIGLETDRCVGAYVLDKQEDHVLTFRTKFVVLATGGAGKVYLYTSNPDVSTGDGIAMAARAGCDIANMEFMQFHPTCLYHPEAKSFLVTEAIRGEGGKLLLPNGERFMERFDKRAELAPRDIVARAIDHEMKRTGSDSVYLDISHRSPEFIKEHFPNVSEKCLEFGFDITKEPIPVVPAAHYICGGVITDIHGKTTIPGLYAIGETSCTGLHGANRMASNSLLECLVFAQSCHDDILTNLSAATMPQDLPLWDETQVTDSDEEVVVSHNWDELRRFMWDYVGIVRTTKRLQRAKNRVELLKAEISEYYGNFRVSNDLIELRNLVQVADLIIESALLRHESRGLHYTLDYPDLSDKKPLDTILRMHKHETS